MNNFKFSCKLNAQIINYFQEQYGIKISNIQAEEFLNSLANLYLAFYQLKANKQNK
jgi:hypothetical protein